VTSTKNVFQTPTTLESTFRNDAIPFMPEIKICCYKYLGCFICWGNTSN
jgi:hypothetical protein